MSEAAKPWARTFTHAEAKTYDEDAVLERLDRFGTGTFISEGRQQAAEELRRRGIVETRWLDGVCQATMKAKKAAPVFRGPSAA